MSDPFIEQLNKKHLCSWYILPLLGLNIDIFGASNFLDTFIVRDKYMIAVQIIDVHLCPMALRSKYIKGEFSADERDFLLFEIPRWWRDDYDLFIQGAYSKMSDEAKQKIREASGLKYEVLDDYGNKITDAILMALDNHPVLRKKWMEVIGTSDHWIPDELLSLPAESSFITIGDL